MTVFGESFQIFGFTRKDVEASFWPGRVAGLAYKLSTRNFSKNSDTYI